MSNLKLRMLSIAFAAILPFHTAFGQLTLVSHAPAHGAVQVDTATVVELTFSEPIDDRAEFEAAFGEFLVMEIYPDVGGPDDVSLVNDRTVHVRFTLEADTQYWVLVWAARSTEGDLLEEPSVFTFTTGTSLPTASVSGTVSSSEVSLPGTVVGLFPPEGILGDGVGDTVGGLAVVNPASGSFAIDYVAEGDYIAIAIRDTDFDGNPSSESDGFGGYDPDGDRRIDTIAIGDGEVFAGIDITLRAPQWLTGRELFPEISAFAESILPGAELTFAGGIDVDAEGRATIWFYEFASDGAAVEIITLGGFFASAPIDAPDPDALAVPDSWIDSDDALATSEELGGMEFRAENPDALVVAFLTMVEDVSDGFLFKGGSSTDRLERERSDVSGPLRLLRSLRAEGPQLVRRSLTRVSAEPAPVWIIQYFSDTSFFLVVLNAETGEVLHAIGLPTSAHANLDAANAAAMNWSADARLVLVTDLGFEGVGPDGRSVFWIFTYYDVETSEARAFETSGGRLTNELESSPSILPSIEPLPDVWVSSEDAVASADAASDGFRDRYEFVTVSAVLARGQRPDGGSRPIWRFTYFGWDDETELTLDVDAETGFVVTSSEVPASSPEGLHLHSGYPNPFASSTALRFNLPSTAAVRVAVYDALGREVALLADGVLPAGSHALEWRPESLPSGLYVARLTSAGTHRSAMLTLVR